jgi:RimJ/RimL family protein N-acetyltransferase
VHEWASQARVCRYQLWGPNTRHETDAFVTEAARTWEQQDGPRRVWVAEVPVHGVIGNGEIKSHTSTCMEIAYAVHPDHWGRGLGTNIANLLVSVAFADRTTERVQATCDPRNEASARVLKNVGMSVEGTLRHTLYLRDGWRDSVMHSVLRQEWLARAGDDHRVSTI